MRIETPMARRLQAALKEFKRADDNMRTRELDDDAVVDYATEYVQARRTLQTTIADADGAVPND